MRERTLREGRVLVFDVYDTGHLSVAVRTLRPIDWPSVRAGFGQHLVEEHIELLDQLRTPPVNEDARINLRLTMNALLLNWMEAQGYVEAMDSPPLYCSVDTEDPQFAVEGHFRFRTDMI